MKIFTKRILLFTLSLVAILSLCALSGCEEGDFSDILSGSQDDNGSLSDGENQGANEHEHNFAEIVLPQYLKAGVTCETPAVYYKSCAICGEKSELTFEYGTPEHLYGEWVCNGSGTHTKTCARVTTHTLTEDCSGGTATCTSKAVCSECGGEYGDLLEHTYAQTYVYDETHHWLAATCGCDLKQDYAEHTFDDEGWCTVCDKSPFTEGVLYDLSADGTYAEVIGYEGTSKKVRIADTYNDLPVKNIYDSAFISNKTIIQVIIPDSVTSIGEKAFQSCSGLTSITIGNGVTSIGSSAFSCCSRLTSITIPDSVTSIGEEAFSSCSSLTSVTIGNGVTYIGYQAFYQCGGLTSITIPDSVTSIGERAFFGCSSLTNVTIPNSVNSIGEYAFFQCGSLTSVTIPDSVTSIGSSAFYGCSGLTSITIPDSVTSIGSSAFYGCSGLTSITIPDSVTSIGTCAFWACSGLTSVYYNGTAEEWSKIDIDNSNSELTSYRTARYYYSETQPADKGNYWHYDENGNIVVWENKTEE